MKVIDVLNKWANDEDVIVNDEEEYFANTRTLMKNLNSEIEIIKDKPIEDKKIEKLDYLIGYNIQLFDDLKEYVEITTNDLFRKTNKIINKINEIIDRLNGEDND